VREVGHGADGAATGSWLDVTGPAYVAALTGRERVARWEGLRAEHPVRDDGSIHLTALAWTVQGHAPG
jgi:hypothetical protein